MKKEKVIECVKIANRTVFAVGSGVICGSMLRKILPRELSVAGKLSAIAAATVLSCAVDEHIGAYKYVDAVSEDLVNVVDEGLQRFGYVREER